MFFDRNMDPTLSTCTVMRYLIITTINNDIIVKNSISKNTSMISEYSDYITDSITVF